MTPTGFLERFQIPGRVAVVTGGAGLLGSSHALALGQAGGRVVIADIDGAGAKRVAEAVTEDSGAEALALPTDVTDADSVKAMVDRTLQAFGRLDILVNNAALDPKFDAGSAGHHSATFEDFPLDAWRKGLDVNVTGMFLCAQAAARPMLEAGSGVIVNIASTYGLVGPDQRLYEREGQLPAYKPVTYSVSKAAALGLTRYLATYFAGKGIRVNALTPGGVFAGHDEVFLERYSLRTVLGRMADKEEISAALLFLVSDASSYMTGANLVVDGGWTAW
ncbi:MAG TPA: SDR family oxidoreductase [Anaerolineales bacterium]|nr:SDR family oxidoreductase [Anaerolineales bacterium]